MTWLRGFYWAHPEWWIIVLAALAWLIMIPHAIAHQGHVHHMMPTAVEFLHWNLMVMAMMVPLMLEPIRWVAFQSFRNRRHIAVLLFLSGFLLPWLMLGTAAASLRTMDWVHNPFLAAGMFGLAAIWVTVPLRSRALVICHLTVPLSPSGWMANRDCLRYGCLIGNSCVFTCGALMLACAFTGHNLVPMLGGAGIGVLERRSFRPPTRWIFAGTLLLAIWYLLPISYAML